MPSQRHDRAIRQILLDLARQSAIELTKDDADSGIGVAREQGGVQIELIVTRYSEDRNSARDAGLRERLRRVRLAGDKDGADCLHRARKIRITAPQHDDVMTL